MGNLITLTTSKHLFLCFSLFYLFFTYLFLALYVISSQSKCLFRSPPFDPIQSSSLFSYPSSYGQHKYAISTSRSTCSSPLNFSGTIDQCQCLLWPHKMFGDFFCFWYEDSLFWLKGVGFCVQITGTFWRRFRICARALNVPLEMWGTCRCRRVLIVLVGIWVAI